MEAAKIVPTTASKQDIVETFLAAGNFKTLSSALKAADLVATLKGAGPYTVFAPTDEAFKKLPAGTVDGLLKDKVKLTAILKHHVVNGAIVARDVKSGDTVTVNGDMLNLSATPSGITVDKAKIIKADIAATNGVIHSIDTVVMPH
jgi:uncharacterized surface protein with fasciclin (FAS1) repeats